MQRQRAVGAGVGSCCQGRWCVIFSPLCLLPVGQGLLEQGVADLTECRGGEGSQQGRQESGQTHSTTVAGQQPLLHLASPPAMRPGRARVKLGLFTTR